MTFATTCLQNVIIVGTLYDNLKYTRMIFLMTKLALAFLNTEQNSKSYGKEQKGRCLMQQKETDRKESGDTSQKLRMQK